MTKRSAASETARIVALAVVVLVVCRTSFAPPLDAAPRSGVQSKVADQPRIIRNVRYGSDLRQRFDVYAPANAHDAPVIFMVHGGGWAYGDKSARGVAGNKVARWVPRGFVVISTNYRMVPKADPIEQARDVARAVVVAQQRAASWGADRTKFVLMGHSAGAHLVALLAADSTLASGLPINQSLGVVSIESGALDVGAIMRGPHARLYDRAFGRDTSYWRRASPIDVLSGVTPPMLLVCSSRRGSSCPRADRFAAKATSLGGRASVLREDLSHADADALLGVDSAYTAGVERFLRSLDTSLERLLAPPVVPVPAPPAGR
jgi:acetyl esterase/lipase